MAAHDQVTIELQREQRRALTAKLEAIVAAECEGYTPLVIASAVAALGVALYRRATNDATTRDALMRYANQLRVDDDPTMTVLN